MTRKGGALLLGFGLAGAVGLGLLSGAAPLSPGEVLAGLSGRSPDPGTIAIVRSIRLPRVLAGGLVGAALALSGVLFQALLRNPLAEPYLLGVSSGAAFGAVVSLAVLGAGAGPGGTTLFALAGALLAIAVVFRVASAAGRIDTRAMILAGVVIASFFGAAVMLVLALSREDAFRSAVLWTMGSLDGVGWQATAWLAVATLPAAAVAFGMARHLNGLALGEEAAAQLGTPVDRIKKVSYLVASLVAAVAVSVAGVIGFVGLVVPHAVRMVWGADHRVLIPLAALGGAVALVLSDAAANVVVRPLVLPVGVVTAVAGVPLFLVLLRRTRG